MRTRRLLGATLTTALAVGMLGAAMPTAAAGDNDKADWDGRRVVRVPGAADGPVQVHTGGGIVARNIGDDTWRIRVGSVTDGYGNSDSFPKTVSRWQATETPQGVTIGAYVRDGHLIPWTNSDGGLGTPPPVDAGPIVLDVGEGAAAIVANGDRWLQHFNAVSAGIGAPQEHWESYPDPNVDGVPGAAGQRFGIANHALLAFWNDPNGDLRVARRPLLDPAAPFGTARTVASGEKVVRYVETARGGRLVTQSTDGSVNVYAYVSTGPDDYSFTARRVLAPASAGAPVPQVLVDRLGTLTVGFRETGTADGGLMLWQEDRPVWSFLERPTLVPGTRRADARVVTSPRGTLTVALRRNSENAIVRVKHLPAGKGKWTNGRRLVSPKPIIDSSAGWGLSAPSSNGDLSVALNDTMGVYGFRFDAPRPTTKVTKPVRKVQRTKTYRIGWNTSWAFADDWQVRMRLDKRRGGYGPWKVVNVDEGDRSKTVTRARGKTWCYEARGYFGESRVSKWSKQRCVTVRR